MDFFAILALFASIGTYFIIYYKDYHGTLIGSHIHCVQKKTPTHVFDYNSGVSLSIYNLYSFCTSRKRNEYPVTTYLQS